MSDAARPGKRSDLSLQEMQQLWLTVALLAHFLEQLLGSESPAASTVAHNAKIITTVEYEPETDRFMLVEFDNYRHLL